MQTCGVYVALPVIADLCTATSITVFIGLYCILLPTALWDGEAAIVVVPFSPAIPPLAINHDANSLLETGLGRSGGEQRSLLFLVSFVEGEGELVMCVLCGAECVLFGGPTVGYCVEKLYY